MNTFDSLLTEIRENIKPDLVMWTGDSVPHNLDTLTIQNNIDIMKNVTKMVKDGLKGYKMYPSIGNHDTYPQDVIKMTTPRENAAINAWGPAWDEWIEDPEQIKTWRDWGYFSLPFVDSKGKPLGGKHTKVISLNSNICYMFNWATFLDYYDPGDMLSWLEKELYDLEKKGGAAIIISHVPNTDECNRQYGRRYHAIMDRFQTVIRFGIYAHLHKEQYQVQRDIVQKKPIGMNFIIGSVTTYQGKPPSFNVAYLDPETLLPVEFETHAFDLVNANKHDKPRWFRYLDYKKDYHLRDLSPDSFYAHSLKIYEDVDCARHYAKNRYVGGPGGGLVDEPISPDLQRSLYCQTVSNDFDETQFCHDDEITDWHGLKGVMTLIAKVDRHWFSKRETSLHRVVK